MLSRSSLRSGRRAVRCLQCAQKRGLAGKCISNLICSSSTDPFASSSFGFLHISDGGCGWYKVCKPRSFRSHDNSRPCIESWNSTPMAARSCRRPREVLLQGTFSRIAHCAILLTIITLQNTQKRSALRIVRETELLGSQLISSHDRENLIIGAKFMRADLPYFVELLSEVASQTIYFRT